MRGQPRSPVGCPPPICIHHAVDNGAARSRSRLAAFQRSTDATRCDGIAAIGRRRMPPVSEPRRPGLGSKSWRERPRRRERGVAPRLSGRVVHATTCLSVSEQNGVTIGGEYAPPADHGSGVRSRAHSAGGSHPRSQRVSAPGRPPDLRGPHAGAVGTFVNVELCSTPCKVLRFAPTPLARGLRTLTASARSSRPWLLRAGQGLCAGLVRMSRETDTLMTERLTTVSCGGILRSLRRCHTASPSRRPT